MKAYAVLLTISWWCWIFMVEPQCCMATTGNEHQLKTYKTVRFSTERATRNSYMRFMKDLHDALTDHADRSGDIPVLPPPLQPTNPRQYVLVELSNDDLSRAVTLALNVSDVYILGYQPRGTGLSYFLSDVPSDVRNVLFPGTLRGSLPFTDEYGPLEAAAGVVDRRDIPLGITELRRHIQFLSHLNPDDDSGSIAEALIVCIQMVSEAVRLRNIQREILAVAQVHMDGTFGVFHPDALMLEYQTRWRDIAAAVQSATFGIFPTPVRLEYDGQELVLSTVRQVVFTVAIMPSICAQSEANLQILRMPTTPTGLEDNRDTCERVLEPTSHILGQNGLCVDVSDRLYHEGNKIILWPCGKNQSNQLWVLRTSDNTIRSGGKCLTTYGYSPGSYVMIYSCDKAAVDATKWEIQRDGTIRNPKSGLVLTSGNKDSDGKTNLVVDHLFYGSKQAFYATNKTTPAETVTRVVGYGGMCLHASGDNVFLKECASNTTDQQWAIYPDGTIRPDSNRERCLKYGNLKDKFVANVDICDGMSYERWGFQIDGTISLVNNGLVLDAIIGSDIIIPRVTVSPHVGALGQIWFQT